MHSCLMLRLQRCVCPCRVLVVDDVEGAIAQYAVAVDVQQTSITFVMPSSQGRKKIYVQVDGQVRVGVSFPCVRCVRCVRCV